MQIYNNIYSTLSSGSVDVHTISVIIPTFNEERYIGMCIESINNCNYPKDKYEIIVVDNGSIDNTVNIANLLNSKVLVDKKKTIGGLRNTGCKEAKGVIYAFLDADCTVEIDWLKNAAHILTDKTIGITGCLLNVPKNASWIENSWYIHLSSVYANHDLNYINSGNCFIRKEVFEKVAGFSEILTTSEDTDICEKIKAHGWKIYNCHKISATHWGYPKTIKDFLKREIWHGIGATKKGFVHFWRSKPILLAMYNILVLFAILFQNKLSLLYPLLFLFPPFLLALKTRIKSDQPRYFLKLLILYSLYGIARTISLLIVIKGYMASQLSRFLKKEFSK